MGYYLANRYKKYAGGGWSDQQQNNLVKGMGLASTTASLIDGMVQPDSYGRKPMGADVLSNAMKFGQIGAMAGPVGAGVGALAGAAVGYFTNRHQQQQEQQAMQQERAMVTQNQMNRSRAVLANNPSLVYGNQNATYYAGGGKLASNYLSQMNTIGGSLKPMSSDSAEVEGPSHEQGGVQLPDANAEVEGGETMHNDFVFSDRLGFADEHKRIAKAIGKIEDKGLMSPERKNAVHRLEERQENLKLSQEYLKQLMLH